MRVALTHSVNTIAIKLLDAVGIDAAIDFARLCGIESALEPNLSLALGTAEVTPIELLRGYLTLARGGSRIEPILVRSIEIPGQDPWAPEREPEQVLDSGLGVRARQLDALGRRGGHGVKAKALGVPVAGKTGTAAESRDAWFAGFTDDLVAIAWVGFDTPKPMNRESGGKAALPIWLGVMRAARASDHLPIADPSIAPSFSPFSPPPGVSVRTIDKATGLLAATTIINADGVELPPDPATIMQEYFLPGTEPTEVASAQAEAKADILLDLYGDEPADAELDAAPQVDEFEAPSNPSPTVEPQPESPAEVAPAPSEPAEDGYDTLPSL